LFLRFQKAALASGESATAVADYNEKWLVNILAQIQDYENDCVNGLIFDTDFNRFDYFGCKKRCRRNTKSKTLIVGILINDSALRL
jgi:hypothetical protein